MPKIGHTVSRTVKTLVVAIGVAMLPPAASRADTCAALSHTVPADRIAALSRGFNADGWLNGPQSTPPSAALLRELRKAGMTHVRLPVPAERLMRRFASLTERDDLLHELGRAIGTLASLGYSISIDLHPGDRFNQLHRDDPGASMDEMKRAWTDLAQIMKDASSGRVFAELLNEPDVKPERWQKEVEELAAFVRQLLPDTTLIVGPVNWQRADSLPAFRPLSDLNTVYAIHFYDPMAFTHQGHWDSHDPLHDIRGLPWPIRADDPKVEAIRRQLTNERPGAALEALDRAIAASAANSGIEKWLEPAATWQRRFSRPIIINEFGVLKAAAPRDSRLRWLAAVTTYAGEHCWGWAHWELAQGFGLVNDKTGMPDPDVVRALLGPR
ncbi:MAG: endoglucanase [Bradyrhizobium sp.]|nr:endoglucanase [Bradyrhizobium sp.]